MELTFTIVKLAGASFGLSIHDKRPGETGCKVNTVDPQKLAGAGGIAIDDVLLSTNGV